MKIGFFDSGIGGISVLHQARKEIPGAEYLYYADTEHVPYGMRSKEEIAGFVDEAVAFLIQKGAEIVVLACNTATSVAVDRVRNKYQIPILGMEPAVKPAVYKCRDYRVLVTATPVTVKEEKIKKLIHQVDGLHRVDLLPLASLVKYAEAGIFDDVEVEQHLRKELSLFCLDEYGVLVLGCTHFTYFRPLFRKLLPGHVEIIDGAAGTVAHLKKYIPKDLQGLELAGLAEFYHSGRSVTSEEKRKLRSYLQGWTVSGRLYINAKIV